LKKREGTERRKKEKGKRRNTKRKGKQWKFSSILGSVIKAA